jgi:hypothetical protein
MLLDLQHLEPLERHLQHGAGRRVHGRTQLAPAAVKLLS